MAMPGQNVLGMLQKTSLRSEQESRERAINVEHPERNAMALSRSASRVHHRSASARTTKPQRSVVSQE